MEDAQIEKVSLLTSELAKYEVANALLFSKKLTISESKISLTSLHNLPITFFTSSLDLSESSFEIAKNHEITFYDASFIALAKKENAILITDNPKHQKKFSGIEVISLKNYGSQN